jgi:hypothetical protein
MAEQNAINAIYSEARPGHCGGRLTLPTTARISYDPRRHGRNARAIRALNNELRQKPPDPNETKDRLQQHVTSNVLSNGQSRNGR